jgi:uncharacterized protein (TIGR02246 family)
MSTDMATPREAGSAGEAAAAVATLPARIVAAWAVHDADAFADVFTEDGSMILPGSYRKGRSEIRAFMADGFAGPYRGTRVTGEPVDLRFIDDGVAVLITQGGVLAPGEAEVAEERRIRAIWLAVNRDGRWRLAHYQNSPLGSG